MFGLTQSIREQNWTANAIEFVLLVAGVFFGTRVSNWNETRHYSQRARDNLVRIEADPDEQSAHALAKRLHRETGS